jgi:hypothetical protein
MSEIIQGDNGTILEGTVSDENGIVDIRGASVIFTIKSSTKRIEKNGTVTDGQNGIVQCVLNSDDVQDVGNYIFQATVKFDDGKIFSSNLQKFKVGVKI